MILNIGIDQSINSTAMVINEDIYIFSSEHIAYNKSGLSKWYKDCEQYVKMYFHTLPNKNLSYSEKEVEYVELFSNIAQKMKEVILSYRPTEVNVAMEGYNYSMGPGAIIDLVGIGTAIRLMLFSIGARIEILSPSTVKTHACSITYGLDKKGVCRRPDGLSGGRFNKEDIHKSLLESDLDTKWVNYLRNIEIGKKIPKPHEDISDAIVLQHHMSSILA